MGSRVARRTEKCADRWGSGLKFSIGGYVMAELHVLSLSLPPLLSLWVQDPTTTLRKSCSPDSIPPPSTMSVHGPRLCSSACFFFLFFFCFFVLSSFSFRPQQTRTLTTTATPFGLGWIINPSFTIR